MGNRGAKWSVRGFFCVDVDPLMITGRISELIDALLRDFHAGAWPESLPYKVIEVSGGFDNGFGHALFLTDLSETLSQYREVLLLAGSTVPHKPLGCSYPNVADIIVSDDKPDW